MGIHLKQNKNGVVHTEFSIQKILVRHFMSGAKYMVPNMYCTLGEMDMFLLRQSGYAEEFEIKCSTSDLRADFKKRRKHQWLANCNLTGSPFSPKMLLPNRFSYVLGPAVKTLKFVFPEYAGLYVVRPYVVMGVLRRYQLICLTAPKLIHKQKCNWHERVATSCCHRLLKAYKLRY